MNALMIERVDSSLYTIAVTKKDGVVWRTDRLPLDQLVAELNRLLKPACRACRPVVMASKFDPPDRTGWKLQKLRSMGGCVTLRNWQRANRRLKSVLEVEADLAPLVDAGLAHIDTVMTGGRPSRAVRVVESWQAA
jgi:hypothetical protein